MKKYLLALITPTTQVPCPPQRVETKYSTPYINMIGINWGAGEIHNDSTEWFTLTEDWVKVIDNNICYFSTMKQMIYNFSIFNN